MGQASKPWSSVQPRTPGEQTRETWRLRPGALTLLPPPPAVAAGLSSLLATAHTAPLLSVEPQVPEGRLTPPPGPSVENNHRPFPPAVSCPGSSPPPPSRGSPEGREDSPECLGFGVVVSLGERDWISILQEQGSDAKDFPHQSLLGFLHNLGA